MLVKLLVDDLLRQSGHIAEFSKLAESLRKNTRIFLYVNVIYDLLMWNTVRTLKKLTKIHHCNIILNNKGFTSRIYVHLNTVSG